MLILLLELLLLCMTTLLSSTHATFVEQTVIFNSDTRKSPWNTNYTCFRVPTVARTKDKLLVFVESRIGSCSDQAPKDITMRSSEDNGKTWSALNLIVGPKEHNSHVALDFSARNPYATVLFNGSTLLQWVNSTNPNKCVNFQMISNDGETWSTPIRINLGQWEGTLLGPGTGIVLGQHSASVESGRIVICGASGYVGSMPMSTLVWYSDDNGATYSMGGGAAPFAAMQECQVVELNNGSVILNMRNSKKERAIAISQDGGATWESRWYDQSLPDPTCSAGLINMNGTLYFSNDPTTSKRENMTLKRSLDSGKNWETYVQLTSNPSAYSVMTEINRTHVAVIYETGKNTAYESVVIAVVEVVAVPQEQER